jgi:chaperonin GroEL
MFRNAAQDGARIIVCTASRGPWRDCFQDTAVATGARIVGQHEGGPAEIDPTWFGQAAAAWVEAGHLVIDGPYGGPTEEWIAHLRQLIEQTTGKEQEWHCLRLAQLAGRVVTVETCGKSLEETEQLEELGISALHAGRAAIATGYLPGGGVAYLRAALACEGPAGRAIRWALEAPTRALLMGTGFDMKETLTSLRADEVLGLDLLTNELPPWRTRGPVDPTSIIRTTIDFAIESAIRMVAAGNGGSIV